MALGRGYRLLYIGRGGVGGKESPRHRSALTPRSPLDEPTLINSGDGLSKAVGNQRRKETLTGGTHRPASLQVGPVGLSL